MARTTVRRTRTRPSPRERWRERWFALRRRVLLRRRLLAAGCIGLAAFAALRVLAPLPPDTVEVSVAARDLPAGAVVADADLDVRHVDPDQLPAGLLSGEDLRGRTLGAPVRAGEMLTDARAVAPGLLAGYPGSVAVPVRIPDAGSVGLLRVGDRIDVTAADPRGSGESQVVAHDAVVLALPGAEQGPGAASGLGGRLVVLATSAQTAQDLAWAGVNRHLSFVLSGSSGPR